jgi:predicted metalloprotease with PDZ domain
MTAFLRFLLAAAWLALPTAHAQEQSAPAAGAQVTQPLPVAADRAYPGVIRLEVDAADTARKIFRIRQTIPVSGPGPVTLLYPEWIPGNHAPRGPVYNYAGLRITAGGKELPWTRDPGNVYVFRVQAPAGVKALEIEAQYLNPVEPSQGPIVVTADMMRFNWYVATLYPAGHYARNIQVEAVLKLPKGWTYATALEAQSRRDDTVRFKTVSLETLLDSPVYAGNHAATWELQPGSTRPVRLNAFGDAADMIAAPGTSTTTISSFR